MASKRQRVDRLSSEETPPAENATTKGQSSDATYIRPRTRQRVQKPPPPLAVPDISEDATERKRVLNVLAQRRYSTCSRLPYTPLPALLSLSVSQKANMLRGT